MQYAKTIFLAILMIAVFTTIYLNNLTVNVTNPPEQYETCSQFYYHPQSTFLKIDRTSPSKGLFWLTKDNQVIENLILMPGMKVNLTKSNLSQEGETSFLYNLMYKDEKSGGAGIDLSATDADYLQSNINGLEVDGDEVLVKNYYGYIDERLTQITPDQMLGQISECKEQDDTN